MKKIIASLLLIVMTASIGACTIKKRATNPLKDIYVIDNTERYTSTENPKITELDKVYVSLCKNEKEAGQFVIRSEENEYKNLSISVSELKDDKGNIIPKENIKVFREYFTTINSSFGNPPDFYDKTLQYPTASALLPMEETELNSIDTKKGENTIYLIDIETKEDTKAGIYNAEITLTHADGEIKVPLQAEVWDITLPETPHYRSYFAYNEHWVCSYSGLKTGTEEYKKLATEILDLEDYYLLSPGNYVYDVMGDYSTPEEYAKNLAEYKKTHPAMTAININLNLHERYNEAKGFNEWYFTEEDKKKNIELFEALIKYGVEKDVIFYSIDEPYTEEQFDHMNTIGQFFKESGYDDIITNLVTSQPKVATKGSTNTWCPILSMYDDDKADQIRKEDGCVYWWYFCNNPPAPGVSKEADLSNTRMHGWMAHEYDIKGILYWALNLYEYYYADENGDYNYHSDKDIWNYSNNDPIMLLGKAGDGIVNKSLPIPTLTMTAVRDGIEDFELLVLLEEKVQEKIKELNLPITVDEAMEGYYRSLYLRVNDFPTNEAPYNITEARKLIAHDIISTPSFILQKGFSTANGEFEDKVFTVFAAKDTKIEIPQANLVKKDTSNEKYDTYSYTYKSSSRSDFIDIEVNGESFKKSVISSPEVKEKLVDFSDEGILEKFKERNPALADKINIVEIDGEELLSVEFDSSSKGLFIPNELFTADGFKNTEYLKTSIVSPEGNISMSVTVTTKRDRFIISNALIPNSVKNYIYNFDKVIHPTVKNIGFITDEDTPKTYLIGDIYKVSDTGLKVESIQKNK